MEFRLGSIEEFGGYEVFEGAADAFEERDLGGRGADQDFAGDDLMKVGEPVGAGDTAGLGGDDEITGFGLRSVKRFDSDARALDGSVVELAGVRLEGTDGVDVSSLPQHGAVEERGGGSGARTENVGFGGAGAGVDGFDLQVKLMRHGGGEVLGARDVSSADQGALIFENCLQDVEVGASLAPGAEDTQDARVGAR
jgi:hypothetical protein